MAFSLVKLHERHAQDWLGRTVHRVSFAFIEKLEHTYSCGLWNEESLVVWRILGLE